MKPEASLKYTDYDLRFSLSTQLISIDSNKYKNVLEEIYSSYMKYCPCTRILISLFLQMKAIFFNYNRKC